MPREVSLRRLFAKADRLHAEKVAAAAELDEASGGGAASAVVRTAIDRHLARCERQQALQQGAVLQAYTGLHRIRRCRRALEALDRRGWQRSFHQRLFHEEYLKSCARIFFKRDGPGAFARLHSKLLEENSWDSTPQEILVSTPRRFGKTISVSMFAAAMIFACPNMVLSIYSTCKRISAMLLRNIVKFLELIFAELKMKPYKFIRLNQEEVRVRGPEGEDDVRVINSYPSKIGISARASAREAHAKRVMSSLEALYEMRDPPDEATCESLRQKWLWETDCNEAICEALGNLNYNQCIGLLLCVIESKRQQALALQAPQALQALLPHTPATHLYGDKPFQEYTLREMMDQLECLQLNWSKIMSHEEPCDARNALAGLMARFGVLVQHAYDEVDDLQYATELPSGHKIVSQKCIRQTCCVLLALSRVLYIVDAAEVARELDEAETAHAASMFKMHHVESSLDTFFLLQQMMALAPGMRLVYRNNFAGMYNDVSQVVYFHFPKYVRQPQLETLDAIVKSGLHTLPLVTQLFPDIPIVYDDDTHVMSLSSTQKPPPYVWLIACSTIFLLETQTHRILCSSDGSLLPLLQHMGRIAAAAEGGSAAEGGAEGAAGAPYSHIMLL